MASVTIGSMQQRTNETINLPIEWYDLTFADVTRRNQSHYAMFDTALRTDIQLPDVRVGGEGVKELLGPGFHEMTPQATGTAITEYWATTGDQVLYIVRANRDIADDPAIRLLAKHTKRAESRWEKRRTKYLRAASALALQGSDLDVAIMQVGEPLTPDHYDNAIRQLRDTAYGAIGERGLLYSAQVTQEDIAELDKKAIQAEAGTLIEKERDLAIPWGNHLVDMRLRQVLIINETFTKAAGMLQTGRRIRPSRPQHVYRKWQPGESPFAAF